MAMIPLLAIVGGVLVAADVGLATAWILLGLAFVWLMATIWWSQQVPATRSGDVTSRMWFAPRSGQPGSQFDDRDR